MSENIGRARAIERNVSDCPNCGAPALDGGDGWILCSAPGAECTLRADRKTWESLAKLRHSCDLGQAPEKELTRSDESE
jgi:hypothetical protein